MSAWGHRGLTEEGTGNLPRWTCRQRAGEDPAGRANSLSQDGLKAAARRSWRKGDTHQSLTPEVCLQTKLVSKPQGPKMLPLAPFLPISQNSSIHESQRAHSQALVRPPGHRVFGAPHGSMAGPLGCPLSLRSRGRRGAPAPELCVAVAGPKLSDTAGASSLQTIPYFNGASPPKLIIQGNKVWDQGDSE